MIWRETTIEDLDRIKALGVDTGSVFDAIDQIPDPSGFLKEHSRSWLDGDTVLAIVGMGPMWKGVGTVWTLLTDEALEHGVSLTRGIIRFLDMLHVERGYWRIQATVEDADEPARQWILQLGFHYEGTMVGYGPDGKTHHMYARLRG